MPFVVYVQNVKTGMMEEVGVYEQPPLIVAEDGSQFFSTKVYGRGFKREDN
jgi:hypothetical protein